MKKNDFVFDITNIDINLPLDKSEIIKSCVDIVKLEGYNKKVKINGTVVDMKFLSNEKLSSKVIVKILN